MFASGFPQASWLLAVCNLPSASDHPEQVMAAASKLGGYSMGQADLLRRAMGKKDKEKMAKERANFIAGCARTNDIGGRRAR